MTYEKYFASTRDFLTFALLEMDGEVRQKLLGVRPIHYRSKSEALQWRNEIMGRLGSAGFPLGSPENSAAQEMYQEMIGE